MGISLYRLLLFEMGHPGTPTRISSNKPARFPVPERAFRGWKPPCLLHRCSGSESAAWLLREQDLVIFVLRKVKVNKKWNSSNLWHWECQQKLRTSPKNGFLNWFNLPRIFVPSLKLTHLPCTTQLSRVQIDASVFNWFNVLHVPHGCTWWLAKAKGHLAVPKRIEKGYSTRWKWYCFWLRNLGEI